MKKKENNKKIKISIVVPCYNEEEYISNCLINLLKQNIRENYEIIVIDNNSKDKTLKIIKSFEKKYQKIKVFKEPQKGVGYARQNGFEKTKGEIIASTDADSRVPSWWLSEINNIFITNPEISAVAGIYDFYDETKIIQILRKPITHISIILDKI